MTDTKIKGKWSTKEIWINNFPLYPHRSRELWNYSPEGFGWGYNGNGSAQLALAILPDRLRDKGLAVKLHQRFNCEFVALFPREDFETQIDLKKWVAGQEMSVVREA